MFYQKILTTMMPTQEEAEMISNAQLANPNKELGPAEYLLQTMYSIKELEPRLHIWVFKMDYDHLEKVGALQ